MRYFVTSVAAALIGLTPCFAQELGGTAFNDDVKIAYWVQGYETDTPLVIVNGQGAATRVGGDALVNALLAKRFRVITFDNRDSGQSMVETVAGAPPQTAEIVAALSTGKPPAVAYDLSDMADDAVAVLDAVGIEKAHFLGHSLGGMIVQMVAADHPDRVLSMISVSATSGAPDLPL